MRSTDALARFLWELDRALELGLDVYTDPDAPPGHLVVRFSGVARLLAPEAVEALAARLWGAGYMDPRGRPLGDEEATAAALAVIWNVIGPRSPGFALRGGAGR